MSRITVFVAEIKRGLAILDETKERKKIKRIIMKIYVNNFIVYINLLSHS